MNTQGDKVIRFIEEFLTLGGSFLGQPFEVLDFQREVIRDIYRLDDNGRRQHLTSPSRCGAVHLVSPTAIRACYRPVRPPDG